MYSFPPNSNPTPPQPQAPGAQLLPSDLGSTHERSEPSETRDHSPGRCLAPQREMSGAAAGDVWCRSLLPFEPLPDAPAHLVLRGAHELQRVALQLLQLARLRLGAGALKRRDAAVAHGA